MSARRLLPIQISKRKSIIIYAVNVKVTGNTTRGGYNLPVGHIIMIVTCNMMKKGIG